MEIKKILDELEKVNDINTLSLNDLMDKYFVSEEKYKDFLTNYGEYFTKGLLYQFRVIAYYRKITDLVVNGNKKYADDENKEIQRKMFESMDYILNKYKTRNLVQDEIQSRSLFTDMVGASRINEITGYEKIVSGIYDVAKKYDSRDGNNIDEFALYALFSSYNLKFNNNSYEKAIKKYMDEHNLAYLCNDVNFLFFVNYMLKQKGSIIDEEFINDSKKIIELSLLLNKNQLPNENKNVSDKNYKRVARYTMKNISRYEKNNKNNQVKKIKK